MQSSSRMVIHSESGRKPHILAKYDSTFVTAASVKMKTVPLVNQSLSALTKLKSEAEPDARTLSAAEVILAPSTTLDTIKQTIDLLAKQLLMRAKEGTASSKEFKAIGELVKANSTLRQTQLEEDKAARSALSIESDEQVALMLVQAITAGGPKSLLALESAIKQLTEKPSEKE